MLDIRKLKELVRLMVANDLTELDLRDSEEQVTLRRQHHNSAAPPAAPPASPPPAQAAAPPPAPAPATTEAAPAAPEEPATDPNLHAIKSPMVGTFYSAPNPDAPPYVTVGTSVSPDTVVCLVEAMKIFNEIKAECSGVVEKVAINNGDSIDFGQTMFLVRPA